MRVGPFQVPGLVLLLVLVVALKDILKLDEKTAQKARDNLTTVLEKSRKL